MSTKELSGRQARWAEFLSEFEFVIMYRPGKLNTIAETLSRREQDISPQQAKRKQVRQQTILGTNRLDKRIISELSDNFSGKPLHDEKLQNASVVNNVEIALKSRSISESDQINSDSDCEELVFRPQTELDIDEYDIVDQVLQANRSAKDLELLRQQAINGDLEYKIRNELLYYQGRLEVPSNPPELRAKLIRHVHAQPIAAHPGTGKTKALIGRRFK